MRHWRWWTQIKKDFYSYIYCEQFCLTFFGLLFFTESNQNPQWISRFVSFQNNSFSPSKACRMGLVGLLFAVLLMRCDYSRILWNDLSFWANVEFDHLNPINKQSRYQGWYIIILLIWKLKMNRLGCCLWLNSFWINCKQYLVLCV